MSEDHHIRVLIVDDSPFVRKALQRIFEADPSLVVVGTARNGREAVEKTLSLKPDVVTLDIMMPVMDGIETLKILMDRCPVPVLILSQFTHEGADLTLKALQLGAMDFVDKSSRGPMDFLALTSEIIAKVKAIAHNSPKQLACESRILSGYSPQGIVEVVALGASTGGPPALEMILRRFPKGTSVGFLIVQHMPKGFTASLAERLDNVCSIRVKEAEDRDRIEPGLALIAPSGLHMKVRKGRGTVRLDIEPMNFVHRPSVDVLFQSVGETYGSRSIGVILTGMGSDGVKGLGTIRERGGLTLAQDESTSVIFGMPRVAINSGVVDKVVPLNDMAEEILKNV
ncbi:MAG TPA: chemotaxis response regulator protein-glutamate methylesterase [Thermodesulfovibrionales bacterium]|nr:chemotaxis response regulator protein-glutamate methylesterase [Thermodesulfovibrionales bacterium]